MAYQNVGTPRFYVNALEWAATNGAMNIDSIYRTLPVKQQLIGDMNALGEFSIENPGIFSDKSFVFYLGHNCSGVNIYIQEAHPQVEWTSHFNVGAANVPYDGFSYSTFKHSGTDMTITFSQVADPIRLIGSIVIGSYYDMKNAPNLSLTMEREYGGTKEFTTHNGSSMSNTMWTKPPLWGNLGAWELQDGNQPLSKSGRRTWDLKFSYMDDGDLWGSNQTLGNLSNDSYAVYTPGGATYGADSSDYDPSDITDPYEETFAFNYNILTDDNFFSQVWHKTLGGTLPFIFQPDGDGDTPGSGNNNPDQFAICRFKDSSLKATQTAFNVYDISLSIEEVW